jgi:hypothetical protein
MLDLLFRIVVPIILILICVVMQIFDEVNQ